ncbi:MAG: hypothetical protein RIQ99_1887 [Pseudomonadota bacterium]
MRVAPFYRAAHSAAARSRLGSPLVKGEPSNAGNNAGRGSAAGAAPGLGALLARAHLRLILFAVALSAASLLLSGGIVIRNVTHQNLGLIARAVAGAVAPGVTSGDPQAIRHGILSVEMLGGIDRIEVRDSRRQLLATWRQPHAGWRGMAEQAVNRVLWPAPAAQLIGGPDGRQGEVRVYANSDGVLRYALCGAVIALACLGLTVLAARVLAGHVQHDVIDPLVEIGHAARTARLERAFDRRLPAAGIREIDRLGEDFNALLAELQGWQAGATVDNAAMARSGPHDALTGLGNRALFEAVLDDWICTSARSAAPFALLYLDVDGFGGINAAHGRESGDVALIVVADRLRASLRQVDCAFRVGSDEFALLLAPLEDAGHVVDVVARLNRALDQALRLPTGAVISASLSAGVAFYPDHGLSASDLLRRADADLYRQKSAVLA